MLPLFSFSDPVVLLKHLTIKQLLQIGNEGLRCIDPHTCCFCHKIYSTRLSLSSHIESVHRKIKKLCCDSCPKFFFSRHGISEHIKIHRKTIFACNICDYTTATQRNLERHNMNHVEKVECPVCKKKVTWLYMHMEIHRPKVSCPICHKTFSFKSNMKRHMLTHKGKLQKCKICDEIFTKREDLRR